MRKDFKKRLPFLFGDQKKVVILRQVLSLILATFFCQVLLQLFQNDLRMDLVINFIFLWHTEKFIISWVVLMVVAGWLWAVVNNIHVVNLIMIGSATLIGFTTYEKMSQRDEPLYPADFRMIFEIDFIAKMVTPVTLLVIILVIAVLLALGIYFFKHKTLKLKTITRIVLLLTTSMGLYYLSNFQEPGNLVKKAYDRTAKWIPYSQKMNYYNTGFVAGFLYNLPSDPMAKPLHYSSEGLETLFQTYKEKADIINRTRANKAIDANVIYVMNESFADPLKLERTTTFDPIPFTRRLMGQVTSGDMLSQGYGGGTANIEFEALTSFSMEPFTANISTPYTQFLPKMKTFPSLVSRLKTEGHHAFAIHPFNTSMYKRRDNYEMLGFDVFIYDEIMKHTGKIGNHPYISDASSYKEVLEQLEASDGYDFGHLVTMQNHTPFKGKYKHTPNFQDTGFIKEEINQYHQDLVESDKALEKFVNDLQKIDETTLVVFWGDHWPSVFGESMKREKGDALSRTPAIVFGNQRFDVERWDIISPIYFTIEIWEQLNVKITPFEALLMEMREEIPAIEKGMYYLSNGDFLKSRDDLPLKTQALLKEYDWVMYDTTTGSQQLEELGFFEIH